MKMIFLVLSSVLSVAFANGYGGYPAVAAASAGAYSGAQYQPKSLMAADYGQQPQPQALTAAIRGSNRNIKVIDVPSSIGLPVESMTINVPPSSQPLTFVLRSRSSDLNLQSTHEADPGSYQESSSEDKPHVLVHTVTRPVLQEIREIIAPYRKVTQEVKPVQESSETLVARAQEDYQPKRAPAPQPKQLRAKQAPIQQQYPAPKPIQQQYAAPKPIQQLKQKSMPYRA